MSLLLRPIFAGALAWATSFLAIGVLYGEFRNPEDAVALLIVALFIVIPFLCLPGTIVVWKVGRLAASDAPRGTVLARGFAYGLILGAVPALPGLVALAVYRPVGFGFLLSLPFLAGGITLGLVAAWILTKRVT